ncbi:Asp-tRNA(Asn)/Glu-tRNA(Gln) amidotransferase subunit GatB [Aggregatilinea lenta]|uniref:Asp-tRNA(Asn)/Glu-tRNA(Gln) amidotransferase subunit GatB n=1 Tax=Aggregatilinea lenta TaxID=913108 RepID=UPI000E5BA252|nr:Asp-tRNA(Asn)/Glu-tRNA(Gln) amidotransferase subunit GatB [Aggregatilinea lenta]
MTAYEPVIGLEVHAELETRSKMFCGCAVVDSTTGEPNRAVCPVCLGMPGALPVINRQAVEFALMVGLALHCEIPAFNQFARKSYFYPDLPKGYQISQFEYPLAINGWLDIDLPDGSTKRIGIRRAHLEEDAGKLTHVNGHSLVDLNRAGVPLLEIVSEADMRSAEEAEAYARKLRTILQYLGVNSGDMSKGVLRFESNVSVRPVGSDELRTRTEIKNLNSIRALTRGTEYEIARQTKVWESGGEVQQATMGWDEARQVTVVQRVKESSDDYRYFPEPDLPIVEISREWVDRVRAALPELPDAKETRFIEALGLTRYDAAVLVAERAVAEYFEAAVQAGGDPKQVANYLTGDLFRLMNQEGREREEIGGIKLTPQALAKLVTLVQQGTINHGVAKQLMESIYAEGGDPAALVEQRGLAQVSDESVLSEAVAAALDENPDEVARYLAGEDKLIQFLMGKVMRALRGKGDAQAIQRLLAEQLEARR